MKVYLYNGAENIVPSNISFITTVLKVISYKCIKRRRMWESVKSFPHIDAFGRFCSRQLFKTRHQNQQFSFCHHDFNSIQLLSFHLKRVPIYFQAFNIVCCRFVVCRKGLNSTSYKQLTTWLIWCLSLNLSAKSKFIWP